MPNPELQNYIDSAHEQGQSDEQIRLNLIDAGWPEQDVSSALGSGNSPELAVPKFQSRTNHFGMWIVFEYVLMFITLATSAIALAGLAHQFVEDKLSNPDLGSGYFGYFSSAYLTTTYISMIIVGFPIFAFLFIHLRKLLLAHPEIRELRVRQIFIYLALVWTFIALISRLIRVVQTFLNGGENVSATLAHLVVTLVISGSIFLYFMLEVRKSGKVV
jgi:hypothetical protein